MPIANVPGELSEAGRDLFYPKSREYVEAFSDDELRDLAYLYGLVREATRVEAASVNELQKRPEWRRVMAVAKDLDARLAVP